MATKGIVIDPAKLRLYRENAGLSRPAFAEAVGCSRSHLNKIEVGRKNVSPEMAAKMAAHLGVTISDLRRDGNET